MKPMREFRVGIDSYGLHPLHLSPFQMMDWAKSHGAEGVHFSEGGGCDPQCEDNGFLREISQYAKDNHLYLEWGGGQHIPFDMQTWEPKDIFQINKTAASQAKTLGTGIIRSCSGGLMRWDNSSPSTNTLLHESAKTLKELTPMLKDMGVVLAIELHFEFTTFELLRLFDLADAEPGGALGICLDTMNLLTMLESPTRGLNRILPWVVCTHIKDGGLLPHKDGLISFPAEIGKGAIHIKEVIKRLNPEEVTLSVEDHGGDFPLPIFDREFIDKFPDLEVDELCGLLETAQICADKKKKGELVLVNRSDWPALCETRISNGVKSLKQIASLDS